MEIVYFKSSSGNFGDDLNPWLWDKVFNITSNNDKVKFFGIGSILSLDNESIRSMDADITKIVFGTGFRPSKTFAPLKLDRTWDIRFLRGPLSTNAFGSIHNFKYISDAAYAINTLAWTEDELMKSNKKYEFSIMPYYQSVKYVDWESFCRKNDINYISPCSEKGVEHTLREIAASKFLITEAMHGAILADALRVPWHRFVMSTIQSEGLMVSEFKWMDWVYSVKMGYPTATLIPMYQKRIFDKILFRLSQRRVLTETYSSNITLDKLNNLADQKTSLEFSLSKNAIYNEIIDKFYSEIDSLKRAYKLY